MNLPKRLQTALEAISEQEGDDLYFVLGYLSNSTARSYVSQLKARGLAYTHVSNGTVEVWLHNKGRTLAEALRIQERALSIVKEKVA